MKTILSLRRNHYLARVSILLIMVALIGGMAGCAPAQEYTLSISSTPGGNVTHPGIGTFTYPAGAVVLLEVEPEEGYSFTHWSGNVSTIEDVNSPTTTVTMNGHYFITANFAYGRFIRTWYDLDDIRDDLAGYYILMNDLDSSTPGYTELASDVANQGKGWQPIGYRHWDGEQWIEEMFQGILDGQGYEIRGLFINRPEEDEMGLFGSVDEGGIIKNIGMANASVNGGTSIGGLVGYSRGTVSNCHVTGVVTGRQFIGGLVGYNEAGSVGGSYVTAGVTGLFQVGGLAGVNDGTVSNSYATGSITGELELGELGGVSVGGLVGDNFGTLSDSYFTGSVTGEVSVGGLVGNIFDGVVRNCHYDYDEVLINEQEVLTIGALFDGDFQEWFANGKSLDVNDRLSYVNGYYRISSIADFEQLLAFGQDDSLRFRLANDLDLASEPGFYIPYLAGEFDGDGYTIANLSFDSDFVSQCGLFGYLAPGGEVSELDVQNVSLDAQNINPDGFCCMGGLVGISLGTVTNCQATGTVTSQTNQGCTGGLVGSNQGTVSSSHFTGTATGELNVGGLVGGNSYGSVTNSYSSGNVTGEQGYAGGLIGSSYGLVSDSHSDSAVTGGYFIGGLMGHNGGTVTGSYSTGNVNGSTNGVGGLVGWSYGTISDSYSSGDVIGTVYVGGLVGENAGPVSRSYSTGNVTGSEHVGGLVGVIEGVGTVTDSFWDTETTGQSTSAGGTGKTTAEMKDIATFSGAGWNIVTVGNPSTRNPAYIWNIVNNVTYPFLS
jgi:hypothetical protein